MLGEFCEQFAQAPYTAFTDHPVADELAAVYTKAVRGV